MERFIKGEQVFDGRLLKVFRDEVSVEETRTAVREYIRHRGAVCVAPLDGEGRLWFVRQYRYAIGRYTVELPAGKLEEGEDPLDSALRELSEETGFSAASIEKLGSLFPSPAYTTEEIHLYLATGLSAGEQHPDEDEFLQLFPLPLEEAVEKVLNGEIKDAKTQIMILMINEHTRRQDRCL